MRRSLPRQAGPTIVQPARFGYVWKYERGRFVPIAVRTGVADDRWTELISGEIAAGDQLVTAATSTR